jgi:lipooligosaccharide transport system permease protein
MLTTPIEPDDILCGEILWAITRAMIYGGCFFVILSIAGLAPFPQALLTLAVIPLAGLLFACIGIAFSLRVPAIDQFSFYFTLFLTPLFLFSDIFFPLEERLSPNLLWLAEALPLLHPVRLARAAFAGTYSRTVLWDLGYILAVSAVLFAWARRTVHRRLTS